MLYDRLGQKGEAEALFRQVVASHPQLYDAAYSLGLLLAEQQKFAEAAVYVEKAAAGMPDRARVHYNYGLLLQVLKRDREAEESLKRALSLDAGSLDFQYALADFYFKRGRYAQAEEMAAKMIAAHPSQRIGHDLLEAARNQSSGSK
jgi:Tfp pilus assembly protein PilF